MRKITLFLVLLIAYQAIAQDNQDNIEVVNIENQAVQDYMTETENLYRSNSDYRVSVITKYNTNPKYGKNLHWPQGKKVKWNATTPASSIKEIRITASENEDYSDAYTFNPDSKAVNSYEIRNLLPNRTYYYKVEEFLNDGTVNEKAHGVFRTEGQVRMIQFRNNANVRDIGGWNTQYGCPVKYGRLYRSGSLERKTANGRHDFVDNLKVVAELDLRHETKRNSSCLGSDIDYLRIPHTAGIKGIRDNQGDYLKDLKWIIARLKEDKNVDWHCAIGCDRCGTVSFLIEGLLGLDEVDLCRDYELSTFSLGKTNKRVRGHLKGMISYIRTFGSDDDNLARCFYKYWLKIGMSKEELDYFLDTMLDKDAANNQKINK